MAKINLTSKRVQIDKAQATTIGIIAGAVFISVFSLVSAKSLWSQRTYQARVIDRKDKADKQLQKNVEAVEDLEVSYKEFVGRSENVLKGNPTGQGEKDGDNARIILDALPSKYDFPALTASLEKILTEKSFKITGLTGTDDEVAQSKAEASSDPKPVDMPFQFDVEGNYSSAQELLTTMEKSIRPLQIQKLTLSGGNDKMKLLLDGKTFYQPEKSLEIKTEVVQ